MSKTEKSILHFFKVLDIHDLKATRHSSYYDNLSFNTSKYLNVISFSDRNTVSDIAQALGITKSAVTIKMNELEKQGLIKRVQSKDDKRIFYISLTDCVNNEWKKSDIIFDAMFEQTSKNFNQKDLDTFNDIVDFMAKELEKADH